MVGRYFSKSGLSCTPCTSKILGCTATIILTDHTLQVHKLLKGLPPIRSLVAVGSGAAKLVSLPVKNYKKDHRLLKGMQRGKILVGNFLFFFPYIYDKWVFGLKAKCRHLFGSLEFGF